MPDSSLPHDLTPDEVSVISAWIEAWMIGMHCILYCFCMHTLWLRRHTTTARVLMGVTTTMIFLAIAHAALSLRGLLEAFVWQVAGPNGAAYYANFAAMPYKLKNVIYVINTFLADGLLLWRVWVVWGYSWKIALAPAITLIGSTVSEIFTTIALWALQPNESLFFPTVRKWFLSFWTLSLITNVLCTTLIVVRIVRSSNNWRSYRSILLVIIESGALYTLSIVLHMTFYELNAFSGQITNDMQTQLAVIGPTLIIVVVGRRMATADGSARGTVPKAVSNSSGPPETNSYSMSPLGKVRAHGVIVDISRYDDSLSRPQIKATRFTMMEDNLSSLQTHSPDRQGSISLPSPGFYIRYYVAGWPGALRARLIRLAIDRWRTRPQHVATAITCQKEEAPKDLSGNIVPSKLPPIDAITCLLRACLYRGSCRKNSWPSALPGRTLRAQSRLFSASIPRHGLTDETLTRYSLALS